MSDKSNVTFRSIALAATTLSELMVNRKAISTEDMIKNYPDGFTVVAFDFVNIGESNYPVILFKENLELFYSGGAILSKICSAWADVFSGDCERASQALARTDGVKLKLEMSKTKSNNNLVKVTVV